MAIDKLERKTFVDDDVVGVTEAARICGLSVSTLNKRRVTGGGPTYIKATRLVRYRVGDLRAWMASARCASTAEYAPKREAEAAPL